MKRFLSGLILTLFLLHFAGYYIYFVVRLNHLRQEMRSRLKDIPDEQLTFFEFTSEEFKRVSVNDHEIEVNGRMYDLARISYTKDAIQVYALHDEAEDDLLALLKKIVDTAAEDDDPVPSVVISLISLDYLPEKSFSLSVPDSNQKTFTGYIEKISTFEIRVESPPPRS